jgi:hypothetical protein
VPSRSALVAWAAFGCFGCTPTPPSQLVDTDCDEPSATAPTEVTADPNVNVVLQDRAHPQILRFTEAVMWDGRLAHKAQAQNFFCHRPERTIVALEAAPGPHVIQVMMGVYGNPDSSYVDLKFDLKADHSLDVPESGVVVLNLDLTLDGQNVSRFGDILPAPRLRYREVRIPGKVRR